MKLALLAFMMCAGTFSAAVSSADGAAAELPLKEVVLFSSGVGSFTHQGKIEGDTSVRFRMSKEQLNDLLKSLYVTAAKADVGIRSVTYPTELPLNTLLEGYRIKVTGISSLSDILRQLTGSEFTISLAGVTVPVKGKLIALETKTVHIQQGNTVKQEKVDYAVMLTGNGIQRFPVDAMLSIVPTDPALLKEMTQALAILAEQRDQTAKPIDINLSAKTPADVRIAYVIEAPVWKASFRLELGEKAGDKAHLQGWALVENPTRTEWKDVTLSLISGRPESFVQDLYTSLYLPRPQVVRENYASVVPLRHGIASKNFAPMMQNAVPAGAMMMKSRKNEAADYAEEAGADRAVEFKRVGGDISATSGAMGELYCYRIAKPVTLGSRQSAMIELISAPVAADKISFYSMRTRGQRPLNAVILKNDTGLLLPQGPVTIFDGKNYGGDASLSDLASGQEQILSYGLDLEVTAQPNDPSTSEGQITELAVRRGTLTYSTKRTTVYSCAFENHSKKDKVILFETPRSGKAKIVNGMKPSAQTTTSYRFMLPVKAGEKLLAEVKMETPVAYAFAANADSDFTGFAFAAVNADLSPESKAVAEKILAFSRRVKNLQQEIKDAEEKIRDLSDKHARTCNSINSNINNELRTRLNKRLAETDDELDKMYQVKDAKKAELQKVRAEFSALLSAAK